MELQPSIDEGATMAERKSIIKRVYVPSHVRHLPNGEKVTVPGHYRAPSRA